MVHIATIFKCITNGNQHVFSLCCQQKCITSCKNKLKELEDCITVFVFNDCCVWFGLTWREGDGLKIPIWGFGYRQFGIPTRAYSQINKLISIPNIVKNMGISMIFPSNMNSIAAPVSQWQEIILMSLLKRVQMVRLQDLIKSSSVDWLRPSSSLEGYAYLNLWPYFFDNKSQNAFVPHILFPGIKTHFRARAEELHLKNVHFDATFLHE